MARVRGLSVQRSLTAMVSRWPALLTVSLLCALLLTLAFPKFDLSIAAIVALVPLFLIWSTVSWTRAFWWGWLSGTLFFALIFHWTAATLFDFVGPWSVVALLLLGAIEGLAVAAVAVVASLVGRGAFRTGSIFAIPAAWVLAEWVRTSGSLGVPFGQIGESALRIPALIPWASVGGVYILTAIIVLASTMIAGVIAGDPPTKKAGLCVLGFLLLLASAHPFDARSSAQPPRLRVAVAQASIAQELKWTPATFEYTISTYEDLTRHAARRGARLVVWPETAITSFPLQDVALRRRLERLSSNEHVWIMAGTIDRPTAAGYYNAIMELTPKGVLGGVYHKRWLLPFAEYLPFNGLLRRFSLLDDASAFLAGSGPHLLSAAGYRFGTMICYESAFAPYARAIANVGADVLVIATNDAWFTGTAEPYEHADLARIQAVSTGRWVIRSAQTGISEIISPRGVVTQEIGIDKQGFIVGEVGLGFETLYDRYGITWLLTLSLAVLVRLIGFRFWTLGNAKPA